jgi:prepilin-type processing-associated H-X9-DG protein
MARPQGHLRYVELIAIIVVLAVTLLVLLPSFKKGCEVSPHFPTCQGNLKQWGAVLAIYQQENCWHLPRVHGFEAFGRAENTYHCENVHDEFAFCPDLRAIFPEYTTDLRILACPSSRAVKPPRRIGPVTFGDWELDEAALGILRSQASGHCQYEGAITNGGAAYTYFGWRIDAAEDTDPQIDAATARRLGLPATGPAQVVTMLAHIQPGAAETRFVAMRDQDIDPRRFLPGLEPRGATIERLFTGLYLGELMTTRGGMPAGVDDCKHMQEFVARPWHATTPVMWDTIYQTRNGTPVFPHENPAGVNVLYLDGHVEFRTFPGAFPVSTAFVTMKAMPTDETP